MLSEESHKADKWNILLWSTYDAGNTVFSMGIVSMSILQLAELIGMKQGLSFGVSHFIGSFAVSLSNIIVAVFMPLMGAYSDKAGKRKPFVLLLGSLTILFTGLVYLFSDLLLAMTLFIAANVTYQWGNLFYDAQIPNICAEDEIGRVSAFGVALGYFGSLGALLLYYWLAGVIFGPATLASDVEIGIVPRDQIVFGDVMGMFPLSAIGFLLIAIPYLWSKERTQKTSIDVGEVLTESISELKDTFREIREYPDMLKFIVAYFLVADATNTVILAMKDVAQNGLSMSSGEVTILLGVGIVSSIVLTYLWGPLADSKGPKKTYVYGVGICWIIAMALFTVAGVGSIPSALFFLGAVLVGASMGGTWVVGRQYIIELAPPDNVGQYFGFQKLAGKVSASVGPILFSLVLNTGLYFALPISDSYRLGILSLLVFFVIGLIIMTRVGDYHEDYRAGKRAPYN